MAIDGGQQQQSNNSTSVQSQHPQANGAYNNNNHHDNNTVPPVSSLFPAMRFSWEIKSVDAVFTNGSIGSSVGLGATKLTDLSKEAMLQAIIDQDMRFLSDDSNKTLLSEKKFSKECVRMCVQHTHNLELIKDFLGFFLVANDETRKNVTCLIKEAISSSIKIKDEMLVIGLLEFLQTDKKIKTLTDTTELTEDAVHAATVEQNSDILTAILKWSQNSKTKKFTHKSKTYAGAQSGPKINLSSIIHAAKRNDYERVKILYRYGYRLEQKENMTDPLKKIELFKAIASPAYIVASLENMNEVSADFFCPVKKCFEFACEASFKKSTIPEYKKEYQEIEDRCEDYAISLLEQCEDLREVEIFLQTKYSGNKDANYILAILDSRMKFVAHERFQYVLLNKFGIGQTEIDDEYDPYHTTLLVDMSLFQKLIHVLKQVPCYLLLSLYPFFYPCLYPTQSGYRGYATPWFCKEWRVPLNRGIYTAFSYIIFISLIICYVTEPPSPLVYIIELLMLIFIISYTMRDLGTAFFLWGLEGPSPNEKRFKKRYFTFWNNYNIVMDLFFMIGLIIKIIDYIFLGGHSEISILSSDGMMQGGIAFTFAIIKIIKIGIASKYFGPIILSINAMMKDVMMFLITFFVIMLAFSCGVSYMFNYLQNQENKSSAEGSSTHGVFTYFFWVLLQPFRGNPNYDTVANLPYDSKCLAGLTTGQDEINIKSISKCRMETMYDTACMNNKMNATSQVSRDDLLDCVISRRQGSENLQTAVVPMWVVYQFLVSVVLLRILIVMMTITYKKIYDNLDTQWKYARLYLAIQFFDPDSLLPPPFTFLTLIMYLIRAIAKSKCLENNKNSSTHKRYKLCAATHLDIEYRSLIFSFIDNVKPSPDKAKGKFKTLDLIDN